MEVSARDVIAIIIVVCATVALCLHALTVEQYMVILMAVIGYYFGYVHGYTIGKKASKAEEARR
jgi:hydrogenase/urease accessory protein HupE